MRSAHYLPGNKGNETPHDVIWVDTETYACYIDPETESHHLNFGYACHRRRTRSGKWTPEDWLRFTTIDQLWDWIESKLHGRCKLWLFAHNWAFDWPVLHGFKEMRSRGFELKTTVIESPPVILKWRRDPNTIQVVDTLNIWAVPLKKLGEQIGLDKLAMPTGESTAEEWDAYGRRDVEIIMHACLQWWDFLIANNLGGFANTLAAQALRSYRHRFMPEPIYIDDNVKALELARSGYYGGRTEAYYIGDIDEPVYKLDINSMYPDVMHKFMYPNKLVGHYRRITVDELYRMLPRYCMVARVLIETDEPAYPFLTDDHLLFPVGYFTTTLSTPELIYAMEKGHIKSVDSVAVYEPCSMFTEFVDYMYQKRLEAKRAGNDALAFMYKILMNSLYGKFGQRGRRYEIVDEIDNDDIAVWSEIDAATHNVYRFRQYGGILEQQFDEPEARDSHPAIAAHVTAYARMELYRLQLKAGRRNVFYSDTDSLWVNALGFDRLRHFLDDTRLGKLKLEEIARFTTIHGAKDYVTDGKERIKGIRKTATMVGLGEYEQAKFSTLKGLLRKGQVDAPVVERTTKTLKRQYKKGLVGRDGRVSPLRLPAE